MVQDCLVRDCRVADWWAPDWSGLVRLRKAAVTVRGMWWGWSVMTTPAGASSGERPPASAPGRDLRARAEPNRP